MGLVAGLPLPQQHEIRSFCQHDITSMLNTLHGLTTGIPTAMRFQVTRSTMQVLHYRYAMQMQMQRGATISSIANVSSLKL